MPNEFTSNMIHDEGITKVASDFIDLDVHLNPSDFAMARDTPEIAADAPPDGFDPIMAAGQFEGDIVNVTSIDINELLMSSNNARNAIRNKRQLWPNGKVSLSLLQLQSKKYDHFDLTYPLKSTYSFELINAC